MSKKTIALVTADARMGRFLSLELETLGYDTVMLEKGENADNACLMIVDVDTVGELKQSYRIPLLFVTSNQEAEGEALPWPMDIDLLREAVRGAVTPDTNTYSRNDDKSSNEIVCFINNIVGAVTVEDLSVKLSENELRVLEALCAAEGKVVSRAELMDILGAGEGNASDVYICHLRRKLELPLGRRIIFTERGKGYRTILVTAKK